MIEKAVTFGPEGGLVGVLCLPDDSKAASRDAPGVLFWNAGLVHRVGPHRLNVDLGRRLADLGFASLRFDLSGLGDSLACADARPRTQRVVDEVRQAMDLMTRRTQVRSFVLIGLCSSADDAHHAAVADPRVSGVVCLDGYTYTTWRFCARRLLSFCASPVRVGEYILRKARVLGAFVRRRDAGVYGMRGDLGWSSPPKHKAEEDLRRLVGRGVCLLYIYSGEFFRYYNYRDQFRDMFRHVDFRGLAEYDYFETSDHTYSAVRSRELLSERICGWLTSKFSPRRGTA